jgi:hypothetical protein
MDITNNVGIQQDKKQSGGDNVEIISSSSDFDVSISDTTHSISDKKFKIRRRISKLLGDSKLIVSDELISNSKCTLNQYWNYTKKEVKIHAFSSHVPNEKNQICNIEKNGNYSLLYGVKQKSQRLQFDSTENVISTIIEYQNHNSE